MGGDPVRCGRDWTAGFVAGALEQAIHPRRPAKGMGLVARPERGSPRSAVRHTERLAEAGIEPSVGSRPGSSAGGGPGADPGAAPGAASSRSSSPPSNRRSARGSERVGWFDHRRLLGPIGHAPPAEAEHRHHATFDEAAMAASEPDEITSGKAGAVQQAAKGQPWKVLLSESDIPDLKGRVRRITQSRRKAS